ncbi:MAG: BT4734/BF3469 family protein [Flavobacteriia bacterium]
MSNYLKHNYRIEADPSGKDISRACFLCHDPNAFIHPKHL